MLLLFVLEGKQTHADMTALHVSAQARAVLPPLRITERDMNQWEELEILDKQSKHTRLPSAH